MVGNAHFPTPDPDALEFDSVATAFIQKMEDIRLTEIALATQRSERNELRHKLEENFRRRGYYIENASGGDATAILSAGLEVQNARVATTHLDKPTELHASMGAKPGEVVVDWHAVPRAMSYICEVRVHTDSEIPEAWKQSNIQTRSSVTISGLTSGQSYGFRIRALGPNDLLSPWSAEVTCMAT